MARDMLRVPLARRSLPLFKRMMRRAELGRMYQVFHEEMEALDERLSNGEAVEAIMQLMASHARL